MISGLMDLGRPLLLAIDPETAHSLAIRALAAGLHPRARADDPRLSRHLWDLDFPNPIGTAAGLDKNGEVPDAILACGFGFAEIGTVTPRPQPGNPKPRLFRLLPDRSVINRFGFNNAGSEAVLQRLAARRGRPGIVGVNIGANKDAADRIADYVAGIRTFAPVADYLAVNISSPNTPGLRDLQAVAALTDLLDAVREARDEEHAKIGRKVPVALKLAPDLADADLDDIVEKAVSAGIDAMIVSNTTIARDGLVDRRTARETGGLSGRPLFNRSTRMLARVRRAVGPDLPLIGVGGIDTPKAAWQKIAAGADLIQLYTGLVYEGFGLIGRIKQEFLRKTEREGHRDIAEAVGTETARWADTNP